jgi:hypothetical protein
MISGKTGSSIPYFFALAFGALFSSQSAMIFSIKDDRDR